MLRLRIIALIGLLVTACFADDITGMQPAAIDQPRIYMHIHRNPNSKALSVTVEKETSGAIEAFLDTGASGILLAHKTYQSLGIKEETGADNQPVTFQDIGVGGSEEFDVSEPVYTAFAPYSSNTDGDNDGAYSKLTGPYRLQLRPQEGLIDMLTGGLDVAGMPAMAKKVVVIDARPVNTFTDKLKTSLHDPNDAGIPKTDHHVPLTYVSFQRFTRTEGGEGPTLFANPMIGPDPLKENDRTAPILIQYKGHSSKITMLLDTGAAASMISRKQAGSMGVKYSQDESALEGVPEKEQFSLDVGGIGGSKKSRGFYLDVLALPTKEGAPLRYAKAPVLVADITITDLKTGEVFTLDGVFGMNFLVATANVTGGLLPDIGKLTQGPFTTIVIDHPHATLGLK